MLFQKNMGCPSQKMSPLEVIHTDQFNLSFFVIIYLPHVNKSGMNKLVEQRNLDETDSQQAYIFSGE